MDTTSDNETRKWLNENGLVDIISKCEEHELTKELFMEANTAQLQDLCNAYDIGIKYQLKLKCVLKKMSSSEIAQELKPKIIYLTIKEKEYITKLDDALKQIFDELIQNEKNEKYLKQEKKRAISLVNSSMDEIIEIIQSKRKNMMDEINKISLKGEQQINEHKKICKELKQLFLSKRTEIDQVLTGKTESNKYTLITQIVDISMKKYDIFKKNKPKIALNMKTTVNVNKMESAISKFCNVELTTTNNENTLFQAPINDDYKQCDTEIAPFSFNVNRDQQTNLQTDSKNAFNASNNNLMTTKSGNNDEDEHETDDDEEEIFEGWTEEMTKERREEAKMEQEMLQKLPQFIEGCYSNDPDIQFKTAQKIRKILSFDVPPIQIVIDSGVVSRFIEFLQFEKYQQLQFEAAWILTNIAAGTAEDTAVVIKHGAVPILVNLLHSESYELKEQVIWALGNIASDCAENRDLVLSHGALNSLLPVYETKYETQQQLTLLRRATWTLSNVCRGKPSPDWKYVEVAIKTLNIMINSDDIEILQDTCWALSYLCDHDIKSKNEEQQIPAIINSGCLNRLITLLDHESANVRHPALRTIGNIATGGDQYVQKEIDLGVLKKLYYLMQHDEASIKREACWTVSNITAGSKHQIESVIAANLFQALIHILKNEKYEIAKEALWAICNATSGGDDIQIIFLVNQGVIPSLCQFFGHEMPAKIMLVVLEGIENILGVGGRNSNDGINEFAQYVEESGGVEYLKQLQSDQSLPYQICDKAVNIVRNYFDGWTQI